MSSKIKTIILSELNKGLTPEAIFDLARAASISDTEAIAGFQAAAKKAPGFQADIQAFLNSLPSPPSQSLEKKFWDPSGQRLSPNQFEKDLEKVHKKLKKFQAHPKRLQRNLLLLLIPAFILDGFLLGTPSIFHSIMESENGGYIFGIVFLPAIWYWGYVQSVQKDMIKSLIAAEQGWLYNPDSLDTRRFTKFSNLLIRRGRNHSVEDEFWGKFPYQEKAYDFYLSLYTYETTKRSGKKRRTRTHYQTLFSLHLPKRIHHAFQVNRDRQFSWGKKKLETESVEFNKKFTVNYKGENSDQAITIVKTLSPAVLEKLVNLHKSRKIIRIHFEDDVVFFIFNGKLIPKMRTNFFKKVAVDERDKIYLAEQIQRIIDLAMSLMKYLD